MPYPAPAPEVSIIAEMITPALLILASGSLLATVLARVGRIVELVRKIIERTEKSGSAVSANDKALLSILKLRADKAEMAIILYYAAVFCFVLTCLLIGADRLANHALYFAPVASAAIGLILVLTASGYMVSECRLAFMQLKSEIASVETR